MSIYRQIADSGRKLFAVLVDPDKYDISGLERLGRLATENHADLIFVGGSLLTNDHLDSCITILKGNTPIPVILFPGSILQINRKADALLLLSLISGRNPDLLIGKHVIAAPYLKESKLEILPTGYMLVESGPVTTAQYISGSLPIPRDKDDIAVCTAIAGEMLGLKLIYIDAGSGAENPVPASMIRKVKDNTGIPLIIGGGIRTPEQAFLACSYGADVVVVGNAIEKDVNCLKDIAAAVHSPW
jgi:putative glycerol-1-phosphate prenyltransferase